ncbi:MAG TPA: DNA-binding response regulator [Dehalococcoidia bacterium]|nr:DNA-binding response regulator [Dehalococcoidia bacterium]
MSTTKIIIIDEQPFFRAGVRQALSEHNNFEISECSPDKDALAVIESQSPDVVLLGSDLATHSGLELGRKIARNFPNTKVIILSPDPNDEELFDVIRSAAVACLKKSASSNELIDTINKASRGEYPINETFLNRPNIAQQVLQQFEDISSIGAQADNVVSVLTKREKEILKYISDGNTNKQIANTLSISEQTIKNHVSAILRKLNANDRAHAVVLAIKSGLIKL